ncbi:hypothetical protein [Halopelagius longus]|uniref:DUF5518 domain-containing protein n=1 Tax=Halopelagius longus TaxID=1236180 RepID=A0A1H0YN23_9EURY|nr:hypothetical protein [Halopelagius longus]RDI72582.1 hypothetical protein DWB78_13110 [Halopelagius longus]SDQ16555.1 hypothetical protein SAMN05216278_0737 [Halopelagius longus]
MQRSDETESTAPSTSVSASDFGLDGFGTDSGEDDAAAARRTDSGGSESRLGRVFSPKSFVAVLGLSLAGLFVGGAIPIIGFVGRFLGLFAVGFAVGLLASRRRYLEVGLAGALASGLAFVLSTLTSVVAPFAVDFLAEYGVAVAGIGAGAGLLASLAGHYFGRDLRNGLTQDI